MKLAIDFFLLRSTLLPINIIDQNPDHVIKSLLKLNYFREALYLASPDLFMQIERWEKGEITEESKERKLFISIYKYVLRACSRPIPFGLFAGCSRGEIKDKSEVIYGDIIQHHKECKLDAEVFSIIVEFILKNETLKDNLIYHTNNSLYKFDNQYRYIEYKHQGSRRVYELQNVEISAYLDKIIHHSKDGASLYNLANLLVSDNISPEDAKDFINELINSKLLIASLEPSPAGDFQFETFIEGLKPYSSSEIIDSLNNIIKISIKQDFSISKYIEINNIIKGLVPNYSKKMPLQVDLHLDMKKNCISKKVVEEIVEQVSELSVLGYKNNDVDLKDFKKAFYEKFEDQKISLALALDNEYGIGYGEKRGVLSDYHPLLNTLHFKGKESKSGLTDNLTALQIKKIKDVARDGRINTEIFPEDIARIKTLENEYKLPSSLYIMGSLLANSHEALDKGYYSFELTSFFGPSCGNLITRFCNGNKTLKNDIIKCQQEEEANFPDCIFAEIVHLPNSKSGNIICRPMLREHELVYLSNGSHNNTKKNFVEDILVHLRNGEIYLSSKAHGKRIIPRLTSAHNFHNDTLPLYRFLCDLQLQNALMPFNWSWGIFNNEDFLPRISYKNIILAKARWIIKISDYPEIKNSGSVKLREIVAEIRVKLNLPTKVCISYSDNDLLIDLENPMCQQILKKELIIKRKLGLTEFLSDQQQCFIKGNQGKYVNELIIPVKSQSAKGTNDRLINKGETILERSFVPGAKWLYYKIYCGTSTTDKLLIDELKKIINQFEKEKVINKWFFIRYFDPESHIRIRFELTDVSFLGNAIKIITDALTPLQLAGTIHKIQIDTYSREIERYGSETIELAESIFYLDSICTLDIISITQNSNNLNLRWLAALKGIDLYLESVELTPKEKLEFIKNVQDAFFEEFKVDTSFIKQINTKFRKHSKEIEDFFAKQNFDSVKIKILNKLEAHGKLLKAILSSTGAVNQDAIIELLKNYIHMFINRLFISNQRRYELLLYSFLYKYYDSLLKRNNF